MENIFMIVPRDKEATKAMKYCQEIVDEGGGFDSKDEAETTKDFHLSIAKMTVKRLERSVIMRVNVEDGKVVGLTDNIDNE